MHMLTARRAPACALIASSFLALAANPALAAFSQLYSSSTIMPAGSDPFASFGAPAFDGQHVAFYAEGGIREGIFSDIGGALSVVAERTTIMPHTDNINFAFFSSPVFDGTGRVVFNGTGAQQTRGIYSVTSPADVIAVADRTMEIPGGDGALFNNFSAPTASGGKIVFRGFGPFANPDGLYQSQSGTLGIVADTTTTVPGGTDPFQNFVAGHIQADNVAFRAVTPNGEGIYARINGSLARIADSSTTLAGGGSITGFGEPVISGSTVVFAGTDANFNPLLAQGDENGDVQLLADTTTALPGGTGNFFGFADISINDAGQIVFAASGDSGQFGLYTNITGGLTKLIAVGDELDGKTVSALFLGDYGLAGNTVAFAAGFTDGSSGVFVTTVPEPATIGLFAAAAIVLSSRRRSR